LTIEERVERTKALQAEIAALWGSPRYALPNVHLVAPEIFHATPCEIHIGYVKEKNGAKRKYTSTTIDGITLFCGEDEQCSGRLAETGGAL
jgi:hypothetical protein